MAIKLTVHDEQIFSQLLLKVLDLKFLFWEISIMSHTHDVINSQLKREFQKRQKMEISRIHGRIQILKVGKPFLLYWPFCYFLYFFRNLSNGQEIDHMIKSAKNGNLDKLISKILVLLLWMALGRNKTGNLQGVGEILFWPVHVKEHVRIIGQYRKTRSRPRNFAWVNRFWNFKPQNFASVATVTWIVGSSKFWYQYDRIYVVFHSMDSDFQISRDLVQGNNKLSSCIR